MVARDGGLVAAAVGQQPRGLVEDRDARAHLGLAQGIFHLAREGRDVCAAFLVRATQARAQQQEHRQGPAHEDLPFSALRT